MVGFWALISFLLKHKIFPLISGVEDLTVKFTAKINLKEEYPPLQQTKVNKQQTAQKHPSTKLWNLLFSSISDRILLILLFLVASVAMKCI